MSITATDGVRVLTISNNDQTANVVRATEAAEASAASAADSLTYAERAEAAAAETTSEGLLEAIDQAETARDDAQTYASNAATSATGAAASAETASTILDEINRIEATATTLPAGSSATVSYDPASSPIMTFNIPRGDQGVPGDPGVQGAPGSAFTWKEAVADETALLALPSPEEDEGRVTLDTGNLWLYQDSAWTDTGAPAVGPPGPAGTTDYEELINVPATFPPSAHNHDTVYAKLAGGNTMSGALAFSRAAQAMLTFNNTGNANASPTTIRETNAGDFGIVHGSDNTLALIVEPSGTTITEDEAAVTKEKGDARYMRTSNYLDVDRTFATVADMVASTKNTVGDYVRTLGYLAAGDGGGNEYQIVAAATGTVDGGSYINLSGITGQAKGLFDGQTVRVEQFGIPATGDASAVFTAANAYALTVRTSTAVTSSVKLTFNGYAELAEPISLGGVNAFDVDFSGSFINIITGGDLEADSDQAAVTIQAAQSFVRTGTIDCNLLCGGYRISNSVNTKFDFGRILQFVWRGVTVDTVDGSCAGAVFDKITGNERASADDSSLRTATGIYNDANDVRFTNAHIGYCLYPIWNATGGNGAEFINCHPYNAGPSEVGGAQHPYAFVNECANRVFCYSCYFDNGYIDDRTATLKIEGGWEVHLLSTMTDPIFRVKMPADPADIRGSAKDITMSMGFYTGAWSGPSPTLVSLNYDMSASEDENSKRVEYGTRVTRLIPNLGVAEPDFDTVKQGSVPIRQQYSSDSGRVRLVYHNGEFRIVSGSGDPGMLRLNGDGDGAGFDETGTGALEIRAADTAYLFLSSTGVFRPMTDGTQTLGADPWRWSEVFTNAIDADGGVSLSGLPTHADNTAATGGGLVAGDVYKTATGELRIVV